MDEVVVATASRSSVPPSVRAKISARVVIMAPPPMARTPSTCSSATQPVPGDDRAVVDEALVGVDHAGEVDAGVRVLDQLGVGALGDDDGEGRRGHQVGVAQGRGGFDVEVGGVGGLDRAGELADLLAADVVHLCGRVAAALQVRIDSHEPTL